MSPRDLADVWLQLEKRTDIGGILREFIGKFTYDKALQAPDYPALFELILLFKISFDLQRIYLQSTTPCVELQRYLIPPLHIIGFLSYLCHRMNHFLTNHNRSETDTTNLLRLVAQTLVSGLRVLQLNKEKTFENGERIWNVTENDRVALAALKDAIHLRLSINQDSVDHFLLNRICPQSILDLTSPDGHSLSADLCLNDSCLDLPDFAVGLRPIEKHNVKVVRNAISCLQNGCRGWIQDYWSLYDIWWGVVAASVYECSEILTQEDESCTSLKVRSLLGQYSEIIEAFTPGENSENSAPLADALRTYAIEPYLVCGANVSNCFGLNNRMESNEQLVTFSHVHRHCPDISPCLKHLKNYLQRRKSMLPDAEQVVKKLSGVLDLQVHNWIGQSPTQGASESLIAGNVVYIVNCPSVHPFSLEELQNLSPDERTQDLIQTSPEFLNLDIICPKCDDEYTIKAARLVTPLRDISSTMTQQRQYWRNDSLGEDVQTSPAPPPKVDCQSATPDMERTLTTKSGTTLDSTSNDSQENRSSSSGSTSSRYYQQARLGQLSTTESTSSKKRFVLKQIKEQGVTKTHLPASHVFSADSRTILIWTEDELAIYYLNRTILDQIGPNIMPLRGIKYAAAGSEYFGVIAIRTNSQVLSILKLTDPKTVLWNRDLPSPPLSVAFASDDSQVAVGFPDAVRFYDIKTSKHSKVKLVGFQSPPDNQVIAFSPDPGSTGLGVALRAENTAYGVLFIGPNRTSLKAFKIPPGTPAWKEHGLSAIAYHAQSHSLYLAAFTSRCHPRVFNTLLQNSEPTLLNERTGPGTRIQCVATNVESRPRFVVVNDENGVFLIKKMDGRDHWETEKLEAPVAKLGRKAVLSTAERMSVAMSRDNSIHLFWVQRDRDVLKGHLGTIPDGRPCEFTEFDIHFES